MPCLTAINVVVGKVLDIKPHPNGANIKLANVLYKWSDAERVSQIVFGGKTDVVAVNCLVPVAPPSKLSQVQGVKMRRRKFQGEFSFGELCGLYELRLTAYDTDEVAVIKIDAAIGTPIDELIERCRAYKDLWQIFYLPST